MKNFHHEGRRFQRYGSATVAIGAAFAVEYATWPLLRPAPWAAFIVAVMISAWFGGQGPSLAATAMATVAGQYFLFDREGGNQRVTNANFRTLVFTLLSLFVGFLISARRRAERIERTERRRFQATVASIGDAVIATDATGRISFMNGIAEQITGWTLAESLGNPLQNIFQTQKDQRREHSPVTADGKTDTQGLSLLSSHDILISKDNTERRVQVTASPIVDDSGFAVGSVVTFRDVTNRRRIEEQLDRFAFLAEHSTEFIAMCDLEGAPFYVNPAGLKTVGLDSLEEATNVRFADFFFPEDREYAAREIFPEVLARDHTEVEIRFRHFKTEAALWMAFNVLALKDEGGRVVAYATISKNITERKRIEAELQDARTRLESGLSAGSSGTWTWDIPNDRVVADATLARLFSVSPEVASGGPIARYLASIDSADRERISRAIATTVESGSRFDEEYRLIQADSSVRWVVARGKVERNEHGQAVALPGVVVDITERKHAEEQRQEFADRLASQARVFDTALSNAADFIYTFNLDGRFTYINRALLALLQKEVDDVLGKNFFELDYPPELAERLQRQIQEVIATKDRLSDETLFTSAFGTRFYEYIFVPVVRPDGKVEAVAGTTRDITERKEHEEATRKRALQLQKLADIATRINAAHDVNSIIGVVTAEARELIGAREAATSMVVDLKHPYPVNIVSTREKRFPSSIAVDIEATTLMQTLNVEHRPVRLRQDELASDSRWQTLGKVAAAVPVANGWLAVPLVARDGKSLGLLQLADKETGEFNADDEAIVVQLSRVAAIAIENARLYEELRANDQRKDEFLAMLAHELRNPLSAIGNAVTLSTQTTNHEHISWAMEVIGRQMRHLSRLIDDLMDVSRITRGKIELRQNVVDVTPILESAAATVRLLIDKRKHTLEVALDRGNLWASVDPTRLEQVVVNLLNNAAKYSENAGHIWLSAQNVNDVLVITVKDTGIGISPEKLPEMFEMFVQGDRNLSRSEGGLGIGLTLVRKLVEMHGGSVSAKSDGLGKGSEFTIRLPIAKRPPAATSVTTADHDKPGKKARILVVDDNADTARGMEILLKLLGHDVWIAGSGPKALEIAREQRPEFILLDIGLPGMSGYEVAARLRREDWCKDAVIVAVSGYGQDEDIRRSKEAGFDRHLIKPLDHDALLSLLSPTP